MMHHRRPGKWVVRAISVVLPAIIQACATLPRLEPVPESLTEDAVVPGIPDSRLWLDRDISSFVQMAIQGLARESASQLEAGLSEDSVVPVNVLAISGGGDNGAFAAEVLSGWTASGSRPNFSIVTGISAGALIAPFAYLGCADSSNSTSHRRFWQRLPASTRTAPLS
jgi:hypothetical protein